MKNKINPHNENLKELAQRLREQRKALSESKTFKLTESNSAVMDVSSLRNLSKNPEDSKAIDKAVKQEYKEINIKQIREYIKDKNSQYSFGEPADFVVTFLTSSRIDLKKRTELNKDEFIKLVKITRDKELKLETERDKTKKNRANRTFKFYLKSLKFLFIKRSMPALEKILDEISLEASKNGRSLDYHLLMLKIKTESKANQSKTPKEEKEDLRIKALLIQVLKDSILVDAKKDLKIS